MLINDARKIITKDLAAALLVLLTLSVLLAFGMSRLLTDIDDEPFIRRRPSTTAAKAPSSIYGLPNPYLALDSSTTFFTPLPPGSARISSRFGMRRLFGIIRLHNGLDVAVPTGTPVFAARHGKVTRAGYYGGYGNMVEIDHGNGLVTRYAHCSYIMTKAGDEVDRGEMIAETGNTGRSTGPHLHFEILINGRPVNPSQFVTFK